MSDLPTFSRVNESAFFTPDRSNNAGAIESFINSAENTFYRETIGGVASRAITLSLLEHTAQKYDGMKPLTKDEWAKEAGDDEYLAGKWQEGRSLASLEWFRYDRDVGLQYESSINMQDHPVASIAGGFAGGTLSIENFALGAGRGLSLATIAARNASATVAKSSLTGSARRALFLSAFNDSITNLVERRAGGGFARRTATAAGENLLLDVPAETTAQFIKQDVLGEDFQPFDLITTAAGSVLAPLGLNSFGHLSGKAFRGITTASVNDAIHGDTAGVDTGFLRTQFNAKRAKAAAERMSEDNLPSSLGTDIDPAVRAAREAGDFAALKDIYDSHSATIDELLGQPRPSPDNPAQTRGDVARFIFKSDEYKGTADEVTNSARLRNAHVVSRLARDIFGTEVRFFSPGDPVFGGARGKVSPASGSIYLRLDDNPVDLWEVAGHEMFHKLARTDPKGYGEVVDAIMAASPDTLRNTISRFLDQQGTDIKPGAKTFDEVMATAVGQIFRDPEFMTRLQAHAKPGVMVKVRNYLRALYDNIRDAIRRLSPDAPSEINAGLRRAHDAVARALTSMNESTVGKRVPVDYLRQVANNRHASKFWTLFPDVHEEHLRVQDKVNDYVDNHILTDRDPFAEYDQSEMIFKGGQGRPSRTFTSKLDRRVDPFDKEAVSAAALKAMTERGAAYGWVYGEQPLWGYRLRQTEGGSWNMEFYVAKHSEWNQLATKFGSAPRLAAAEKIIQKLDEYRISPEMSKGMFGAMTQVLNKAREAARPARDGVVKTLDGITEEQWSQMTNLLPEGGFDLGYKFIDSEEFATLFDEIASGRTIGFAEFKDSWNAFLYRAGRELTDESAAPFDFLLLKEPKKGLPDDVQTEARAKNDIVREAWDLWQSNLNDALKESQFGPGQINRGTIAKALGQDEFIEHPVIDRPFYDHTELDPFRYDSDGAPVRDPMTRMMQSYYDALIEEATAKFEQAADSINRKFDIVSGRHPDLTPEQIKEAKAAASKLAEQAKTKITEVDGLPATDIEHYVDAQMMAKFTTQEYYRFLDRTRYADAPADIKKRLAGPDGKYTQTAHTRSLDALGGEPASNMTDPVAGNWATDAVRHAEEQGIETNPYDPEGISGDDNLLTPEQQKAAATEAAQTELDRVRNFVGGGRRAAVSTHVKQLLDEHGVPDFIHDLTHGNYDSIRAFKEQLDDNAEESAKSINEDIANKVLSAANWAASRIRLADEFINSGHDFEHPRFRAALRPDSQVVLDEVGYLKRNLRPGETLEQAVRSHYESSAYQSVRRVLLNEKGREFFRQSPKQIQADMFGQVVGKGILGRGKDVARPKANIEREAYAALKSSVLEPVRVVAELGLDNKANEFHQTWLGHVQDIFAGRASPEITAQLKPVADALKRSIDLVRGRVNAAGGDIGELNDFVFTTVHRSERILARAKEWRDMLLNPKTSDIKVDWERVEKTVGPNTTDAHGKPEFSRQAYVDSFLTYIREGGLDKPDSDPLMPFESLGQKDRYHRTLFFLDGQSTVNYDMQFGSGDPWHATLSQLGRRAERSVFMKHMGPDPEANLAEARGRNNSRILSEEGRIQVYLDQLTGRADNPYDRNISAWGQSARAFIHAAVGWTSGVAQIGDYVNLRRALREMGADVQSLNFASFLKNLVTDSNRLTKEARDFLELQGSVGDSLLMGMRMTALEDFDVHSFRGHLMDIVNTFNGSQRVNRTIQFAFTEQAGMALGKAAQDALNGGEIDPQTLRWLEYYGINETQFRDMAKHADIVDGLGNGQHMLVPSMVPAGPMRTALRVAFEDSLATASTTPSGRELALLRGGTRSGTPMGEVARILTMYKGFTATTATRARRRWAIYDGQPHKANSKRFDQLIWVGQSLAVGSFVTGLVDMANGREPLHFMTEDQRNLENIHRLMVRSGAFMLTSGLDSAGLNFRTTNDGGMKVGVGTAMLGPGFGPLARAAGQLASDSKMSEESFTRTLLNMTPGSTLPIWNPIKHMILGELWADYDRLTDGIIRLQEQRTGQDNVFGP